MAARFIDTLRRAGLRVTSQRVAVCEYLARTKIHPTTSQVFEAVREKHPEISQATVYNTLNTLRDLGAIVEISAGTEHTHYETDPDPHVNLVCLRCHQISDLQDTLAPDVLMDNIFHDTGFRATTLQVQVTGFCPACQKAKRQEIGRRLRARTGRTPGKAAGSGGIAGDSSGEL
ncbi:MAG: Fur family transcriptional regulator [Caldilineaceae bacterium]|nr:Fur family transcriptional regulator [Caldilineaceae bacterium]MDE0631462.1 Fur family transcriptional regulator [Caldilineaceae bacterium]MXZ23178.1 transcriptional repressor [Caldilineaceae bacterium SB0665_bin_25]